MVQIKFAVRTKNTVNILLKNTLDAFIGGVAYWAIGWALAFGEGGQFMTGGSGYFNYKLDYGQYPNWFFSVSPPSPASELEN